MALVQVSPQQQDYGEYANPKWVRLNTSGNEALAKGIGSLAGTLVTMAAQKAAENREKDAAIKARTSEAKEDRAKWMDQLSQAQEEKRFFEAEYANQKESENSQNALNQNKTFNDLVSRIANINKNIQNFDKTIESLEGYDSAKERRQQLKNIDKFDATGGRLSRLERKSILQGDLNKYMDQVNGLLQLNKFNIDDRALRDVERGRVREEDLHNFDLASSLANGGYSSEIGDDGRVYVNYQYETPNGKTAIGRKSVTDLVDNLDKYTTFDFKFNPLESDGQIFGSMAANLYKREGVLMDQVVDGQRYYTINQDIARSEILKDQDVLAYISSNASKFQRDLGMDQTEALNFVADQVLGRMTRSTDKLPAPAKSKSSGSGSSKKSAQWISEKAKGIYQQIRQDFSTKATMALGDKTTYDPKTGLMTVTSRDEEGNISKKDFDLVNSNADRQEIYKTIFEELYSKRIETSNTGERAAVFDQFMKIVEESEAWTSKENKNKLP